MNAGYTGFKVSVCCYLMDELDDEGDTGGLSIAFFDLSLMEDSFLDWKLTLLDIAGVMNF